MFKLELKSYYSYSIRYNNFGFQDMTGIANDEIVFSSKNKLPLIKTLKTDTCYSFNLMNFESIK